MVSSIWVLIMRQFAAMHNFRFQASSFRHIRIISCETKFLEPFPLLQGVIDIFAMETVCCPFILRCSIKGG